MAAYQPAAQACGTQWRKETSVGTVISVLTLLMHGVNMKISDRYSFFCNILLHGNLTQCKVVCLTAIRETISAADFQSETLKHRGNSVEKNNKYLFILFTLKSMKPDIRITPNTTQNIPDYNTQLDAIFSGQFLRIKYYKF
jgi:hypothetical protein